MCDMWREAGVQVRKCRAQKTHHKELISCKFMMHVINEVLDLAEGNSSELSAMVLQQLSEMREELEPRIADLEKRLHGLGAGSVQSDDSPREHQEGDARERSEGPARASLSEVLASLGLGPRAKVGAFGVDPNGTGPLDCHGHGCAATGTGCHSECECRHLDAIERQRWDANAGFRYPKRPSLVITASRDGQHCASTWAFNAVRLLFRQAKESCDSYWMRHVTREKLQRRLVTGAHVVVKTHEWKGSVEAFEDLKKMLSHVVLSVRE
ncbi:unnamed protein product, partial [Symbiodinium necroappetens]